MFHPNKMHIASVTMNSVWFRAAVPSTRQESQVELECDFTTTSHKDERTLKIKTYSLVINYLCYGQEILVKPGKERLHLCVLVGGIRLRLEVGR